MTDPIPAPSPTTAEPHYRWYHKVSALIFIIFCMELGMFLVIFPWSNFWDRNLFSSLFPEWRAYWSNAYLRGAVSGLGIVDVYISLVEILRLRRFARH
ncbi:MAG TPA: hypothetical protein VMT86_09915 [Bryobacteraceae bacterium]|nr:hypothetical protein [Bryobacteraceae bacterium]